MDGTYVYLSGYNSSGSLFIVRVAWADYSVESCDFSELNGTYSNGVMMASMLTAVSGELMITSRWTDGSGDFVHLAAIYNFDSDT
jgi:hypothetical protein